MTRTNRLAFTLLPLLLLSACGYFENDRIKFQKSVVGNIKLIQSGDSDQIDLALQETDQSFAIIVGDCHSVYYDSIMNRIYVESPITELISSYYSLVLKDPSSRKVWEALEKHEILETTFKKKIGQKSSVPIKLKQ